VRRDEQLAERARHERARPLAVDLGVCGGDHVPREQAGELVAGPAARPVLAPQRHDVERVRERAAGSAVEGLNGGAFQPHGQVRRRAGRSDTARALIER
jgi:hypothetical protein